jgi:CheY-like chemotaxis protein
MAITPLRILILEDVPMDAELVEYELERARIPFIARRVDTREAFLSELEAFLPDVILSDYTLPRFDGMAALSLARERAPTTPFLIVTGSVNEETAVGCMKAGATDYLLKSNLARIGPAIEGALARVSARTEKAKAQEALSRSEANLRAIFNNSLQAFVLIDPRHHPGAELDRGRVEHPSARPPPEGRVEDRRVRAGGGSLLPGRARGRDPQPGAVLSRHRRLGALVRNDACAGRGRGG